MDRQAIRNEMPQLVVAHLPKNTTKFHFRIYDGSPVETALGFAIDPKPFEATVIALTAAAIVAKTGRAEFAVIDCELASQQPEIGTRLRVTPYFRRNFQGERLDTPRQHVTTAPNGERRVFTTLTFGAIALELPLPVPRCPFLCDMKKQLETLRAPDGHRTLANMLVDAAATDFACVDPEDRELVSTPPELSCAVTTHKFRGRLAIVYDAAGDLYRVELRDGLQCVRRVDEVDFTSLGATLDKLIDDGSWREIKIEVLQRARSARKVGAR